MTPSFLNSVAFKIARRELTGGLKGFWIYLACLILGTAAIAAAGSVTEVFTRGLSAQSQTLLGGDAILTSAQTRIDAQAKAYVQTLGATTETAGLEAMASAGERRQRVEVRGVDDHYPLVGTVLLSAPDRTPSLTETLALRDGVWGVAVSQSFLDGLEATIGDAVMIGPVKAEIRARLDGLPDRIGTPGTFSPQTLLHLDSLIEAKRLESGQLFQSGLRVMFESGPDFKAFTTEFEAQFSEANIRLRGPDSAVDGLQTLLTTLNSFLAIIGIAALVAGGIGVAQATSAFLDSRIGSIAALKALGAGSGTIRTAYLLQLGLLALLGAVIGIGIGASAPFLLQFFSSGSIPLPQALGVYPVPLTKALILGLLAAAIFALPAIGRARATPPSALFRRISDDNPLKTPWLERLWAIGAAAALVLLATATSDRPSLTAMLLAGALVTWGLFFLTAYGIRTLAGRMSKTATGLYRLTLSNLGGPGSLAPTLVPALGLGLTLLTLVACIQANLLRQISETAPEDAPSLVFSQIPNSGVQTFDTIIREGGIDINNPDLFRRAPFILARLVTLNGEALVEDDVAESERWVIEGETSLTYLADQPPETQITDGTWWPANYTGPLQVSVEIDVAKGLGVDLGDTIGFRVFGRIVDAQITSLRTVDWGGFGIGSNTAFILSPGTLEAAEPYHVAIAKTARENERGIIDALKSDLPDVIVFQTRAALETAARLFSSIALAVNVAAGVVTLSGLFVLFGAFAAMARKRQSEAALLKVFGAERRAVLGLYAGEFALAGGAGALIGAIIGVAAAYPIVIFIFEAQWIFPWREVLAIMGLAIGISFIGGGGVGLATLAQRPAQVLRAR